MRSIKSFVPYRVQNAMRVLLGISAIEARMSELEERLGRSEDKLDEFEKISFSKDFWERSRVRWRGNEPSTGLTWNKELKGDNFISKVASYNAFGPDSAVLEIGPGYGRLLKAMLTQGVSFKNYLGVDLSPDRVRQLKETFANEKIDFRQGDVENVALDGTFDVVISSLTFKHLYPTFEKSLANLTTYVNLNGMLFFDLVEGKANFFEYGGETYLHFYQKSEVLEILGRTNLELVAFDQVEHDPEHVRLLVVAKKVK
ncbi:MAG TPA: class I SAM-dependent methyltransferase [Pyrinomonadaceae bacterium]